MAALAAAFVAQAKDFEVKSPDGKIVVTVASGEHVSYSIEREGVKLLAPSRISMMLIGGYMYGGPSNFKASVKRVDQTIPARNFKRAQVRDRYNELTLSTDTYSIVFRAYDDGVAYRFVAGGKAGEFAVAYEQAEFAFPYDYPAYVPYVARDNSTFDAQYFNSFENTYAHHIISKWEKGRLAFLPLTVEAANGIKLCITEADLRDYPGMYLCNQEGGRALRGVFAGSPAQVDQGGHNQLQGLVRSRHNYLAKLTSPHKFPWRVIAIAKEDRQLAESDLTWRLAAPAAAGDWSWVKPGKVAWDWWNDWNISGVDFKSGINNDTYKHYIDFASEHGIEYVILDEGWAVNKQADLMQVVPEIDLPMLCDYAKQKNVGLILWAGYWAFNRDMEGVCKHYSAMGIKGWKIDFMDRDDDQMVKFYEKAAATAAKYHMLVDFHGAYKPTGLQRTYPNIMNFEGIHGLEQDGPVHPPGGRSRRLHPGRDAERHALQLLSLQFGADVAGHPLPPACRVHRLRCAADDALRFSVQLPEGGGMHPVHRLRPDGLGRDHRPAGQDRGIRGRRPPQRKQVVCRRPRELGRARPGRRPVPAGCRGQAGRGVCRWRQCGPEGAGLSARAGDRQRHLESAPGSGRRRRPGAVSPEMEQKSEG